MPTADRALSAAYLCCHFARNLAYYNAAQRILKLNHEGFWLTATGNFLDTSVLEWCKLFGNRNGKYHWQKILPNPKAFKQWMLNELHLPESGFKVQHSMVKDYRDEFVAHLEDGDITTVPNMNIPYLLAWQYYRQLREDFPHLCTDSSLPLDYGNYFLQHINEAVAVYATVRQGN